MKAVYGGLLLLICLQTLIESSDGRWNGRICSEITCADNERCDKYVENGYYIHSCVCSKNYYRKDSTDRCEYKYPYVEFTPELSNDTRFAVVNKYKYNSDVVARLNYNNGNKRPCHGIINLEKGTISIYPSIPQENATKEVLLIESGNYTWVQSSNGVILDNAIEGGNMENETVYVCRIKPSVYYSVGMMQPSTRLCQDDFHQSKNSYELLIQIE